ncbi:MAG TPA: metallophosphoesterase [Gammaproteobacteria bacterium]|nr:metallophosphoesterase [Gammaproteobacteria bacterium]
MALRQPDGYDIIGDIHGQAGALRRLLERLGYRTDGGAYRYPGGRRQAIFIGDYIDRNPAGLEVVDIVRKMSDTGDAMAIMGNHEFNAVAYHTEDPDSRGTHLRPHTDKNERQHKAFLEETESNPTARAAATRWFRSLPMWLDLGEVRVVHASWVPRHKTYVASQVQNPQAPLSEPLLFEATCKGTEGHAAVECLLKGLEVQLPDGAGYEDKDGTRRTNGRLRWWFNEPPRRLRDALIAAPKMLNQLGDKPWTGPWPADAGYPADAAPVFIGHYWLTGEPQPLARNVACVDYSAARTGQKLVAYRWDGESTLETAKFASVPT